MTSSLALSMFILAAEKFIAKVDSGRAHSTETYKELKAALEQAHKEWKNEV